MYIYLDTSGFEDLFTVNVINGESANAGLSLKVDDGGKIIRF